MVDTVNAPVLEQRLVHAALQRLASTPAERLSIRQVASDVGVSHQAPYVHFGNRTRFLAAVAGHGLAAAAADAREAVAHAGDAPLERLIALADAYLTFVATEPHLHDLAYGPTIAMRDHDVLQAAAIEYWTLLREVVSACQPAGTSEEDVQRRCATAWGVTYGIARLEAHHKIPQSVVPTTARDLVTTALTSLYAGWNA